MINKIKRYEPNDNAPERQFVGMEEAEYGDWIKEDDLEIIKIQLGEIISGLKIRSTEDNIILLRKIYDSI